MLEEEGGRCVADSALSLPFPPFLPPSHSLSLPPSLPPSLSPSPPLPPHCLNQHGGVLSQRQVLQQSPSHPSPDLDTEGRYSNICKPLGFHSTAITHIPSLSLITLQISA